jgi:hypothetical protein
MFIECVTKIFAYLCIGFGNKHLILLCSVKYVLLFRIHGVTVRTLASPLHGNLKSNLQMYRPPQIFTDFMSQGFWIEPSEDSVRGLDIAQLRTKFCDEIYPSYCAAISSTSCKINILE